MPAASVTLALVFNELATNSVKYGALSVPEGSVWVSWKAEAEGIVLRWQERNGPPVVSPLRRGFGSTMIERIIPY